MDNKGRQEFKITTAIKYGLNAAIVFETMMAMPHIPGSQFVFYEGKQWNKIKQDVFRKAIPYLNERQINRAIKLLSDKGLITIRKFDIPGERNYRFFLPTEIGDLEWFGFKVE